MDSAQPIDRFLARLEERDGYQPLSDAKLVSLGKVDRYLTIQEDRNVVALGAVAEHTRGSDARHWSAETAVDPSMRFAEFEDVVLSRTLDLVPKGLTATVWSRRPSLDGALIRAGFSPHRSLVQMRVTLPLDAMAAAETTPMQTSEEDVLIAINRAAFGTHPEAASLDASELAVLRAQDWFDLEGIRLHRTDTTVDAFCWTKVHRGGEGEIYRIGVSPSAQGRGLGKAMVLAGFEYLSQHRGCSTGTLWVDESNTPAMRLYASIGMEVTARNREFARSTGSA
jgi:mycothiol synthase